MSLTIHTFWIYLLVVIYLLQKEWTIQHVFLHAIFAVRAFVGSFLELYVIYAVRPEQSSFSF